MNLGEIVAGQRQRWRLVTKLGEGDAGEVYRVESLLTRDEAILKRPHRRGFSSDVLRQANQIKMEGKILRALHGLLPSRGGVHLHTPALLDSSSNGSEFGEGLFIIIEKAPGFDLASLARAARFGKAVENLVDEQDSPETKRFAERLLATGAVPDLIVLRTLASVIALFEKIHFLEVNADGDLQHGVVWNDVKPDHLYWDPAHANLTLIDWGNGRFLEADGATRDRHASRLDDYAQFVSEMGKFVAEANPDLYARLEWPQDLPPGSAFSEGVKPLQERIQALMEEALELVRETRRQESDLTGLLNPQLEDLQALAEVQGRLLDQGEIPDYRSAGSLYARLAAKLAADGQLEDFGPVCSAASQLPGADLERWDLLAEIAGLAGDAPDEARQAVGRALAAGVNGEWAACLWELLAQLGPGKMPSWWDDLATRVRRVQFGLENGEMLPYVAISRLFYTVQSTVMRMGDRQRAQLSPDSDGMQRLQSAEALVRMLEEEVLKKWKALEPAPPYSGIEYGAIDQLLEPIEALLPGTQDELERTFSQPKAQARIIMEAWGRKEFDTARRGLRMLLLWDPHRRRLLAADHAIQNAPRWLARVRAGAGKGEAFQDYLTGIELGGRELRNQVGPARWLDLIVTTLKGLRTGARPADLLMQHPEILNEIPWLNEARSRETLSLPHHFPLTLERERDLPAPAIRLHGIREGQLGPGGDLQLAEALDTWMPEAQGSSARVYAGLLKDGAAARGPFAIKLLRPNRIEYGLPLFREEAQVLSLLRDVPGVTRMVECGFLHLEDGQQLPPGDSRQSAGELCGQVLRYSVEDVQNFLSAMDARVGQGWLPYLALEKRSQAHNLLVYCDSAYTHGQFLPLRQSLLLSIQICDILQAAHERNIVYRDHKILHYYWDPEAQAVTSIDWNIAKRHPQGLTAAERQFDLVQFGARALHHILTGRSAPGALAMGPNRPEEIEQAAHSYTTQWTYDDERLPNQVKDILSRVLGEGYDHVRDLRKDLYAVYQQLPESDAIMAQA